jgi:hypothetical protein
MTSWTEEMYIGSSVAKLYCKMPTTRKQAAALQRQSGKPDAGDDAKVKIGQKHGKEDATEGEPSAKRAKTQKRSKKANREKETENKEVLSQTG